MDRNSVALLGFSVPESIASRAFSVDSLPGVTSYKFGWSLARALREGFGDVCLLSSCPIQNYPLGRQIAFRGGPFESQGFQGQLLGFLNLLVLKHVSRLYSCWRTGPEMLRRHGVRWLFVHGTHTPFLLFALAQRHQGRKVAVVVTDPPGVIRKTDGRFARMLKRLDARIVKLALSHVDLVITLAPELARRFAIDVPTLVFPGVLDAAWAERASRDASALHRSQEVFTIVYAGSLEAAYGVGRLIEAVHGMACDSVRLKLFGRGNQEHRIKELAALDDRIVYGGFVGPEALAGELLAADLLVNPRPTEEDFAAMSFPSKLIEYLAVGRPTLTTRIKSIPDEFQPYFLYIDDESVEGIRSAVLRVMTLDRSETKAIAERGKSFVYANSSERAIGRRIRESVRQVECLLPAS